MTQPSAVALIPARSGSKRIAGKNIRLLNGVPLLAYAIAAARESGVFSGVFVSIDSPEYADIARQYGAEVIMRPPEYAADLSPDIEWVRHALGCVSGMDAFAILRPTSPFRSAATIRRAWMEFSGDPDCDSLRAVERVKQHPGKMWFAGPKRRRIAPLWLPLPESVVGSAQPFHSSPTQSLPEVWVQNASLEITWVKTVQQFGNISGAAVRPFFTKGYEGYDLNVPEDWILAEALIERGLAALPTLAKLEGER